MDVLVLLLPLVGIAFGWSARADRAIKECDRAYHRGYADAVRQYGR